MFFKRPHIDRNLVFVFALSLFALAPLLSKGYFFDAHDADHSVFFLVEFDRAIRDGVLWPRWGPDHAMGYGYPIWIVYAPLAFFVAEGFHLLGLGLTAAVKMTWAAAFLFGGWGMFALLRRWFGRGDVALVGALVYVYAPYHLLTIYVRAALAEFCAMAWFPWVVLAFSDLVDAGAQDRSRTLRGIALAGLALAGLLLTHTGTILVFVPLLAAYLVFALARRAYRHAGARARAGEGAAAPRSVLWRDLGSTFARLAAAGLLAGGLAAIFLLPAFLEQRYVAQESWLGNTYNYQRHFVFPNQLLDPFWGYGYSDDPTGPNDGMSFQLGMAGVVLAVTAAVAGLRWRAPQRSTTAFFLAVLLVTLAIMMPMARPLWDAIGPLAILQFPWRLLSIAVLCLAILAGAAVAGVIAGNRAAESSGPDAGPANRSEPAALIVALAVVLASLAYTLPEYTDITPVDESPLAIIRFESSYPDMIGLMAATEQPFGESPLTAQYLAGEPLQKAALLAGNGEVRTLKTTSISVEAQASLDNPGTVVFYTYDFSGWRAFVDGALVPHRTQPPYGLIAVDVPGGVHSISIRHGATPARTAGAVISLASLLIAIVLLLFARKDRAQATTAPVFSTPTGD
jgi:hypothetical protein